MARNFASANHCSVSKGSIIEFERSPKGKAFFIFSIFSNKFFLLSIFTIMSLAAKRSNPINSFGTELFNFPFFSKIFIDLSLCLFPISKSLKSCAGVIFTAPEPFAGSAY